MVAARQTIGRHSHPNEHSSWSSMKARCDNCKHKSYKHYGGRGISYTPAWAKFSNFLADMGPKPSADYQIERKDYNGHYRKDNCKWIPKALQQYNKRTSKLTHRKAANIRKAFALGAAKKQLAKKYGVSVQTISNVVSGRSWNYGVIIG